jgi:hypothetical protein
MTAAGPGFARAVGALPPISLEAVEATAGLQARFDRKYILDAELLDRLALGASCRALEIDGRRRFRYETVYFDTPDRRLYLDTAHRRPNRFKVRVRTYVDSDTSMLEVKRKDRRGKTEKGRLELAPGCDRRQLDPAMRDFVDASVSSNLTGQLVETITTSFDRSTIADLDHGARYTVDLGLVAAGVDGRTVRLEDAVVVECKSAGRTTPLDRTLWALGIRPAPMSKYCTTLAMLEPSLPANRWHRTLDRYFGGRQRSA